MKLRFYFTQLNIQTETLECMKIYLILEMKIHNSISLSQVPFLVKSQFKGVQTPSSGVVAWLHPIIQCYRISNSICWILTRSLLINVILLNWKNISVHGIDHLLFCYRLWFLSVARLPFAIVEGVSKRPSAIELV